MHCVISNVTLRFTNEMRNKRQLNIIQLVKRIQNDVQDDVMHDTK